MLGTFCLRYERRAEIYLLLTTVVSAAALAQFFLLLLTGHARELRSRASTWTLLLLTLMVFTTVVAATSAAAGANKSCENALADLAHGAFPRRVLLFRRRGRTPQAASGSAPSPSRATRRSST